MKTLIKSIFVSLFFVSFLTSCKKFDGEKFKDRFGYGISVYGTSVSGSYSDFSIPSNNESLTIIYTTSITDENFSDTWQDDIQISYEYTSISGQKVVRTSSGIVQEVTAGSDFVVSVSNTDSNIKIGKLVLNDVDWNKPYSFNTPLKTEYQNILGTDMPIQSTFDGTFKVLKGSEVINEQNIINRMWFFNNF